MRFHLILYILFFSFTSPAQDCDTVPAINQKIVELTLDRLGEKIDRGECWDLAKYVLNASEADWDGFESYGKKYNNKSGCIYPGDIIQFEKIVIKFKEGDLTYTENMYHHTAIIVEVINNREFVIAHQNTGQHGRKVGKTVLNLDTVTSGKLLFYHPVQKL